MMFSELVVLLPCHSLDDFPTHLDGSDADGLLAAWSALWHPALVAGAGKSPTWQRVDSPPMEIAGWLLIVPEISAGQLPVGYATRAREAGATVILSTGLREEILATIFASKPATTVADVTAPDATALNEPAAAETVATETVPMESTPEQTLPAPVDAELVADFLALGFCRLQVELLARQRHYASGLDEPALERELVAAARAAVDGDLETARGGLTRCFHFLAAGKQYFYPVDSYLIDLTLVAESTLGIGLAHELCQTEPVNLLITAPLLEQIAKRHPATWQALKASLARGSVSLVGGEQQEGPLPLVPLECVLANLREGLETFERVIQRRPQVFGRRRYGLSPALPQILDRLGYQGALHVTLDDGRFPLRVQSKVRWQGDDTTTIDALARLPRDAALPQTFLELAQKLGEAMDTDHVATVVLAHWPGMASPWYADLRRVARYTNALGRFITLDDYFSQTFAPGEHARFLADEYRAPYLKQAVANGEPDPLSAVTRVHRRQAERSTADAVALLAQITGGCCAPPTEGEPDANRTAHALASFAAALPRSVEAAVASTLVVNPLSFSRTVVVRRPELAGVPGIQDARAAMVELPPLGFAWVDWTVPTPRRGRREQPIAEGLVLRNEFFEVAIDPATGGIQRLYDYRHRSNRLSQQIALRTPGDTVLASRLGKTRDEQAVYSLMQAETVEITASEIDWGEITSRGQLVDVAGRRLAGFVQRTRVERGSRLVHLAIELDPVEEPAADPWHAYFAARFAWDSAAADLWRGVHGGRHPTVAQQIEAPEYVEIDSAAGRTAIVTAGLPFHRRSAPRILDSLLIVRGETARQFHLAIGVDVVNPAAAAAECLTPAVELHEVARPLAGARQGWLFHVDARSVLATHWHALFPLPAAESGDTSGGTPPVENRLGTVPSDLLSPAGGPIGFRVRLLETKGQSVRVKLRTYRTVTEARKIDFRGQNLGDLSTDQDAIVFDLASHEWAEIEAFW
jgi:alpha-mannosidase